MKQSFEYFRDVYKVSMFLRSKMLELYHMGPGKELDEAYKILAHANQHILNEFDAQIIGNKIHLK